MIEKPNPFVSSVDENYTVMDNGTFVAVDIRTSDQIMLDFIRHMNDCFDSVFCQLRLVMEENETLAARISLLEEQL